ncbi:hypothetical protein PHYPSEUDO_011861 [Phytophthora pseudosyringae]|uniref:Uncharacterized protein n=1 Tax=Phytophthora pseudosyringae TaxID=221518 RepID=A0A8T1V8H5_9STRA|nr:hypothetical protein PHYPSEUDO_011861 [Phytophthora pseudosyringae]
MQGCDDWERSKSLNWWNHPNANFVMFYEMNTRHDGGKFTLFLLLASRLDFQVLQAVRSIRRLQAKQSPLSATTQSCRQSKLLLKGRNKQTIEGCTKEHLCLSSTRSRPER